MAEYGDKPMVANNKASGDSTMVVESVVLDCGVNGCCPTLNRFPDGSLELVGDDGQKVGLNAKQVEHLLEVLVKS